MRREFPKRVKVEAFQRAAGRCEECTARLTTGRFHYDHVVPDALGGEPTLDNCRVVCTSCHGTKTAGRDVPQIAKMKRQRAIHIGAKISKTPLPCGRGSPWKKKMDGTVVRRNLKGHQP